MRGQRRARRRVEVLGEVLAGLLLGGPVRLQEVLLEQLSGRLPLGTAVPVEVPLGRLSEHRLCEEELLCPLTRQNVQLLLQLVS